MKNDTHEDNDAFAKAAERLLAGEGDVQDCITWIGYKYTADFPSIMHNIIETLLRAYREERDTQIKWKDPSEKREGDRRCLVILAEQVHPGVYTDGCWLINPGTDAEFETNGIEAWAEWPEPKG